jgi:hypothetical protein
MSQCFTKTNSLQLVLQLAQQLEWRNWHEWTGTTTDIATPISSANATDTATSSGTGTTTGTATTIAT